MRMRTRWLIAAALLVTALASSAGIAFANGDPASHVLPTEEVFLTSDPYLCSVPARRLSALTDATKDAGLLVKVALIGSPEDLGDVPELFDRPTEYAHFLGPELDPGLARGRKSKHPYRLLVVMPGGFGLYRGEPSESKALERRASPKDGSADALASAAYKGVQSIARSAGKRISVPTPKARCESAGGSSSSSSSSVLMFIAPLALVGLALFAARLGRRGKPRDS
jgi:hypothetical protein